MKKCQLCDQDLPQEAQENPVQALIAHYCDCFRERYKTNPQIMGQDAGTAKRLVKDMGLTRSKDLITTYLQINDGYFINRRHDLKTFAANVSKVKVAHDTGKSITQREAAQADRRETTKNAFARLLEEDESK